MALHPLIAAFKIACETICIDQDNIKDALCAPIGEWAGIEFDPHGDQNDYYEHDNINHYDVMIREFVGCTRTMILEEDRQATDILEAIIDKSDDSECFSKIKQCHSSYIKSLNTYFHEKGNDIELVEDHEVREFRNRKEQLQKNADLLKKMPRLSTKELIGLVDIARRTNPILIGHNILAKVCPELV